MHGVKMSYWIFTLINISLLAVFLYLNFRKKPEVKVETAAASSGDSQYARFLEENILANSQPLKNGFIDSCLKTKTDKNHIILFVSTDEDCSTCVNQEINMIIQNFNTKSAHVWFVSDSTHFNIMKYQWETALEKFPRLVLDKKTIYEKMGYEHKPFYILYSKTDGVFFKYIIDAQYPSFTSKVLRGIRKNIL